MGTTVVLTSGIALGIGWLTQFAYVAVLPMALVGIGCGAIVGFWGILHPSRGRWATQVIVGVGLIAGFLGFQVMDDQHHVDRFRHEVGRVLYADSGAVSDAGMDEEEWAFYSEGADDVLARNMTRSVGFTGPVARWLHRADGGFRTFGAWEQRRVIPLGRLGTILLSLLEIGAAWWLANSILTRIRLIDRRDLEGEHRQLEEERDGHQGTA